MAKTACFMSLGRSVKLRKFNYMVLPLIGTINNILKNTDRLFLQCKQQICYSNTLTQDTILKYYLNFPFSHSFARCYSNSAGRTYSVQIYILYIYIYIYWRQTGVCEIRNDLSKISSFEYSQVLQNYVKQTINGVCAFL